MSKIKTFLGYSWAALGLPIVLATFMGSSFWMRALVDVTGIRVSPAITGDEVARTVSHAGYETRIHKPVFLALFGESAEGFVQVDWAPVGSVPAQVAEDIDYNYDGQADFQVALDTTRGTATVTPYSALVLGLRGTYKLDEAWAVRVDLKNEKR